MRTKMILTLAGGLVIGLVAGLALGGDDGESTGPGSSRTVAGVPIGYQQSREGAIQAALAYEDVLGRLAKMPVHERDAALNAIASETDRDSILDAARKSLAFYDEQFGADGVLRTAVLGYRVASYEPDRAEIELWEVNVVGRPEVLPTRSGWSTRRLTLVWDGDWKVGSPPTDSAGPTPALVDQASDPAAVIAAARELDEVRYVPRP